MALKAPERFQQEQIGSVTLELLEDRPSEYYSLFFFYWTGQKELLTQRQISHAKQCNSNREAIVMVG